MKKPVTAIYWAYANQNPAMLKMLIDSGATFDLLDSSIIKKIGYGVKYFKRINLNPEVLKILKDNGF